MFCQRCHGLLIEDHCIDLGVQESGKHLLLRPWRCINCGNVVTPPPSIQPRPARKSARIGPFKRSARTSGRKD